MIWKTMPVIARSPERFQVIFSPNTSTSGFVSKNANSAGTRYPKIPNPRIPKDITYSAPAKYPEKSMKRPRRTMMARDRGHSGAAKMNLLNPSRVVLPCVLIGATPVTSPFRREHPFCCTYDE